MSAWVLPDHFADALPSEARHIEELRRDLLDMARRYGYELVIPPLVEHLDSLLTGTGEALDLQTFKLVDQHSGRSLGLRADCTPQVARIDAHLLNREGITRLCYCGPVVHTRPARPQATREPLQFGAELYGHAGLEAETEILELAKTSLVAAGVAVPTLDLSDVRLIDAVLANQPVSGQRLSDVHTALASKNTAELRKLAQGLDAAVREALCTLPSLYGDASILSEAEKCLSRFPGVPSLLQNLKALADGLEGVRVGFDLSDLRGYAYYTGVHFALYAGGEAGLPVVELARGGRYDNAGAVFGRPRAAVGFSLDVKELVRVADVRPLRAAILAPWGNEPSLRHAIGYLRSRGETVVCVPEGHGHEVHEFQCNRHLAMIDGQWVVETLAQS